MLTPRWYQSAANNAVWHYLATTSGNPLVVLPTGAGKSLVIALLIQQASEFGARVVVLAHRKELLEQNAGEIRGHLPGIDVGIYSAGLKSRENSNAVVVAGIQSVYRRAEELGPRQMVLVDECHLISDDEDTMYRTFLDEIKQRNPALRIVGLTATPFRTGTGPICGPDRIFQRIVFEAKTSQLIAEGHLCPVTNKPTIRQVDCDRVGLKGGEFIDAEAQAAFLDGDNVEAACSEIVEACHDRHSILIFCSGVTHAKRVAQRLRLMTWERVGVVTSETFEMERKTLLADFKAQRLRWLVNVDVLTTGFDARCVDALAILRMTMSPGLFCQMVGRGLRIHESKTNCLLLDFGGNIARHGSIDSDNFGRSEGKSGGKRDAVVANNGRGKQCPNCGLDVAANVRACPECDFVFPVNHDGSADTNSTVTGQAPPELWTVHDVIWRRHEKKNDPDAPPTLRLNYVVTPADEEGGNLNRKTVSQWWCPEHEGYARKKFVEWWRLVTIVDVPDTVADALYLLNMKVARKPSKIMTQKRGQFHEVIGFEFQEERPPDDAAIVVEESVDDECPF